MAAQPMSSWRRYRWKELRLFIIPFSLCLLMLTQLLLVSGNSDLRSNLQTENLPTIQGLIPGLGLIAVLFSAHLILNFFFRKADQVLLPLVGLLSMAGVMMATRLGPDAGMPSLGSQQLLWVVAGVIACMGVMFILRNIGWLSRYKYTWALVCLILLIPGMFQGIKTMATGAPARDVLRLGPLNFQPTELLKIAIVVFFSGYMADNRDMLSQGYMRLGPLRLPPLRQLGPLIGMLFMSLGIFLVMREMGLALLVYSLFLCMTYLGTGKISYVVVSLLIFAGLAFVGYAILSYVRQRFAIIGIDVVDWSQKSDDQYQNIVGAGQIIQGLIALSSGGIFGSGLGLGHPAGLGYVPVVESDMVLMALGEELGLIGLFAIIGIYLLIIHRGFHIAIEARDPFSKLLAAGLTAIFAIQTLVISAGNLKIIPLTGITLPFLSYGGSSIIGNYMIVGILLRISYNTAIEREGAA